MVNLVPNAGTESVLAPWTPEQVHELNKWQQCGFVHPFTCGQRDNHTTEGILVATENGWICQECDYTQNWCHEMMVNGTFLDNHIAQMKKLGFH